MNTKHFRIDSGVPLTRPLCHIVALDTADREMIERIVARLGGEHLTYANWSGLLQSDNLETPGVLIGYLSKTATFTESLREMLQDLGSPLETIWLARSPTVKEIAVAMRSGAKCVRLLPDEVDDLLSDIRDTQQSSEDVYCKMQRQRDAVHELAQLTTPERDVLYMMMSGSANKTIAARLQVALRTVEDRRSKVFKKLRSRSLVHIARLLSDADAISPQATDRRRLQKTMRVIEGYTT